MYLYMCVCVSLSLSHSETVCGVPPEYCGDFPRTFARCKPWLREHHPELYPEGEYTGPSSWWAAITCVMFACLLAPTHLLPSALWCCGSASMCMCLCTQCVCVCIFPVHVSLSIFCVNVCVSVCVCACACACVCACGRLNVVRSGCKGHGDWPGCVPNSC